MRVFSWMRSHGEISAGLRTEQGFLQGVEAERQSLCIAT
jgi:hypothetical protein